MRFEYVVFGLIIIISAYFSLDLHELAHIVMCKLTKSKLSKWKVGFLMRDDKVKIKLLGVNYCNFLANSKFKALLILFSGPIISILLAITTGIFVFFTDNIYVKIYLLVISAFNLLIFIFTLLPNRNNDGKRIIRIIKEIKEKYEVGKIKKGLLIFMGILKVIVVTIVLFSILSLSSGTIVYFQNYVVCITYFLLGIINVIYLSIVDLKLLEKRIINFEKNQFQKRLIILGGLIFLLVLLSNGLSFRFNFLIIPNFRYIISLVFLIVGVIVYLKVIKVNKNISSSINNSVDHQLVTDGIYGLIRHPLYLSTTLLYLSLGVALGSVVGIAIMFLLIIILILRINNEEKILINSLIGYDEYIKKVKYKLLPFIW